MGTMLADHNCFVLRYLCYEHDTVFAFLIKEWRNMLVFLLIPGILSMLRLLKKLKLGYAALLSLWHCVEMFLEDL